MKASIAAAHILSLASGLALGFPGAAFAGTVTSVGDEALNVEFYCKSPANVDSAIEVVARRSEFGAHGSIEFKVPQTGSQRQEYPAQRAEVLNPSTSGVDVHYVSSFGVHLTVNLPEDVDPNGPAPVFTGKFWILPSSGISVPGLVERVECTPAL